MSFSSVLVANRGEIAVRIIRACRESGLRSVAVFSDADRNAPHVREADEAVHIGPTASAESYLNIERILGAARSSGAEAIHPGYGFLSERSEFARAVVDAGLIFIGPGADVMDVMGRKDHARVVAEHAGVPVTPRFEENDVPADAYPVLVKAAAGGGGKGMHIVREASHLADAIETARREAASAFGDDTLLIEKYVEEGRHIEVQILADNHGNVVHLGERDCSVQRRHQKVVEESPASLVSENVRAVLRESSISLCKEVGYTNAGTVEFLVKGEDAFFLEMNTRLQVEHPVTEAVTGVDLVQWQFDVAAGKVVPRAQRDIFATGHAIEVRVYAEDPYTGFLPQAGTSNLVSWPKRARVDAAFGSNQEVTTAYDPMLSKIIVHGRDRDDAVRKMLRALDHTGVFGITSNVGFLRRLAASQEFARGEIHTGWLDGSDAKDLTTFPAMPSGLGLVAARAWAKSAVQVENDPFGIGDSWRSGAPPAPLLITLVDPAGEPETYVIESDDGASVLADITPAAVSIAWQGQPWSFGISDPMRGNVRDATGQSDVVAPMPGTLLAIDVAEGDTVQGGARLGVIEAMKMEIALTAPYDGVVSLVGAVVGDQVPISHVLFTVDPVESESTEGGPHE